MSHPMWVRGLKLIRSIMSSQEWAVAPYVGAWIETICLLHNLSRSAVAPYVGAWIETFLS